MTKYVWGHPEDCSCHTCVGGAMKDALDASQREAAREAKYRADQERARREKEDRRREKVAQQEERANAAARTAEAQLAETRQEQLAHQERQRRELQSMREDLSASNAAQEVLLEQIRVAQLLQAPEGRAILEEERAEKERAEERAREMLAEWTVKRQRFDESQRLWAAYNERERQRLSYEARYMNTRHPAARNPWLPRGKQLAFVLTGLLPVVSMNFFATNTWQGVVGVIAALAILVVMFINAVSVSGLRILAFPLLVSPLALLFVGNRGAHWAGPASTAVALAGVVLGWCVERFCSRKASIGEATARLRERDLQVTNDRDALIAQVCGVEVADVLPLPEPERVDHPGEASDALALYHVMAGD